MLDASHPTPEVYGAYVHTQPYTHIAGKSSGTSVDVPQQRLNMMIGRLYSARKYRIVRSLLELRLDILGYWPSESNIGATALAITDTGTRTGAIQSSLLGWPGIFLGLCLLALGVFSATPGTIEGKSLAVLHGLCAQQPTHSYYFGEARLPFDARMTGIYGGFALVAGYLTLRGRWRSAGVPDLKSLLVLVLLIFPLAIDGTNSLLKDLQLPYLYEPRNAIRTLTGLMLGTSLATFVWMLVGQTAFRQTEDSRRPVWNSLPELVAVLGMQIALAAAIGFSGLPVRIPLTYLLMASAATVVTGLLLPFVLLVTRSEQRAVATAELARPASLALVLSLVFIGLMSGSRFMLELVLGVSSNVPA